MSQTNLLNSADTMNERILEIIHTVFSNKDIIKHCTEEDNRFITQFMRAAESAITTSKIIITLITNNHPYYKIEIKLINT